MQKVSELSFCQRPVFRQTWLPQFETTTHFVFRI